MSTRYDTSCVSPRDRVAYWQDVVCESYVQLDCEISHPAGFYGYLDIEQMPLLSVSLIGGAAGKVIRRKRDISRSTEECFLLSLALEQTTIVHQRGQIATLRPGDMALYSSTEPYQLSMNKDFRQLVLQMPKAPLLLRIPNAELLTGIRIDGSGGVGKLISQSIVNFGEQVRSGSGSARVQIRDILVDCVVAGLASVQDHSLNLASSQQMLLLRAKAAIGSCFRDPLFNRNELARALGMSVRRLNEIFALYKTSASGAIRDARLQHAAEDLRDGKNAGLSIGEIAFRNGFNNFSHFSVIFRERFHASPREFRSRLRDSGAA
jgi:AraC family transcriptional regulator, positive regulator of tynA and feaB